ncbi:hypothetical protein [Streptomyces sp. NPDC048577]|uniref:hypothetical protein n=1 Tax=Streptomyces sp. NPDC048577 TaxID=3157209 RepID=UPI003436B932
MTSSTDSAGHTPLAVPLLDLAGHFTRRQDELSHIPLYSTLLARLGERLYWQLARSTELTEHARRVRALIETHHAMGLVYDMHAASRITQLSFLAMNTGDLLVSALDHLESAAPRSRDEAEALLRQVAAPVHRAQELTRHAAGDAVDAAAAFARSAARNRRSPLARTGDPQVREVRLSHAGHAALVAVARGQVTVSRDAGEVFSGIPRLSISTLRSLHTRDLTEYHPYARPSSAQRVALSPLGRLVLADRLGNPAGPALSTRPAATASKTTAPVR